MYKRTFPAIYLFTFLNSYGMFALDKYKTLFFKSVTTFIIFVLLTELIFKVGKIISASEFFK